jgi:hypothetical protein
MKRIPIVVAVGFAFAASLASAPVQAQNTRSFVSGLGSDSNPCVLALPCRSFQAAFNATNAGGEIDVLDTAGYGVLNITHAISIVNPGGVLASIAVPSGGTAITITAPSTDTISLRGLTLEGGGIGGYGIFVNLIGNLEIIDCVIKDFVTDGIIVEPSSNVLSVLIAKTFVLNNHNAGIYLTPTGTAGIKAVIDQVTADHNNYGIYIDSSHTTGEIDASINASHADENTTDGIDMISSSGSSTHTIVSRTTLQSNGSTGSTVGSHAVTYFAHSVFSHTFTGLSINQNAAVSSDGTNDFFFSEVIGNLSPGPPQ